MSITAALIGRIVVGVEIDPEETELADEADKPVMRVYVDARWRNRYLLAAGEQGAQIKRDWDGSSMSHLFIDVPKGTPIYVEERTDRRTDV